MLDINKVYVVLFRDNATGHVSGDDPRMKPFLATNAMIEYEYGEPCLAYWAIGDERGHLLEGTIIRQLPNGIVFNARHINETITLTEFTMQEFEQRCRPDMERMTPGSTRDLKTIADVYAFCRRTAPTIHQPEQEDLPMKLTKADIDKVRHIEGFPIGRDEDIIALSRPPYYTACPNPFIEDFIRENGTPYDEATDDYHREPFAADVSEGKNDPIYMAHSYHTKVPYKAIMRYILHYTKPGDIVFDGFCGTGMTGVAAQMCANPDQEMRYTIESEYEGKKPAWGVRNAVLMDLSPIATYISQTYNHSCSAAEFYSSAAKIIDECKDELGWMYETRHLDGRGNPVMTLDESPARGEINYVVWSDVFVCPSCSREIVFWDCAVDHEAGKVLDNFACPHCRTMLSKRDCERANETYYDTTLGQTVEMAKQQPVLIAYFYGGKRYQKTPDKFDFDLLKKIDEYQIPYRCPTQVWPEGEKTKEPQMRGINHVHQMYTKRNLAVLAAFCKKAAGTPAMILMHSVATVNSKLYRYRWAGGVPGAGGGPLSGTLYIPSILKDISMLKSLGEYAEKTKRAKILQERMAGNVIISTQSTTDFSESRGNTVDYIFTDPPFGNNLNYSELSFIWEAWLGVVTNNKSEAIINGAQKKGLAEYQELMEACFRHYYHVLKPGRWITIEFHNSKNAVWNAIQEGLQRSGFVVADVRVISKKQGSFNQVTAQGAVKQDLVISAYKPRDSFMREFQSRAGDPEMAWEFVRQHLRNVPVTADGNRDGKLDIISERQDYLLFDRMVAWHIMNGIPVPMDAHTFYDGLRQRFLERDGMFFLPDQVTEYDDKRAHMELDVQQMSFLVTDEKNAIAWLNYILAQGPKTYQEIQPLYLQELHQSKQEKMPELLDMLRENFVQDEKGAWYIPDLNNAADLAKVRRKALLKEFYDSCVPGKGKLKVFRMEAIRAGFDECWKQRDFATIVSVGERLPEAALQEDQTLLMYYDNACSRV